MPRNLMILGTSSGVGKSILSIGICRVLRGDGLSVAPFKSQNMSNNSYVLGDGREMAKTQAIAAWACEIEPQTDMNPILLKPVNGGTEVIVQGKSIGWMDRHEYKEYKKHDAWIPVMESYRRLENEFETIVLEGAGSPVEMNMKDDDIANMNMATKVGAPVILVADIERGGVFAAVRGTLELLSEKERQSVKGLIINKCRGRLDLFDEVRHALENLAGTPAQQTPIPVLGMIPYLNIDIEDEDGLCDPKTGLKTSYEDLDREQRTEQFDALSDALRKHLDWKKLYEIMQNKKGMA